MMHKLAILILLGVDSSIIERTFILLGSFRWRLLTLFIQKKLIR